MEATSASEAKDLADAEVGNLEVNGMLDPDYIDWDYEAQESNYVE